MRRLFLPLLVASLLGAKRGAPTPTFLEDGPVVSVNPLYPVTAADRRFASLIYDPLFRPNLDAGGWSSAVLEQWSTEADGRLRLLIAKGVEWHDGEPATARDICATLAAVNAPETTAPIARLAPEATCTVDPDEPRLAWVTLPVREPEPWRHLAVPLLPAHKLSGALPFDGLADPLGTGPYRAERAGPVWRLHAADAKRRPVPVPTLERGWAPVADARRGALRAGGAQALIEVAPPDLADLREESAYILSFYDRRRWTGLLVDTQSGPLADAALRRAVDQALDRAALRAQVVGVDADRKEQPVTLLSGPGPFSAPHYNRGVPVPTPDADAARAAVGDQHPTLRLGVDPGVDHGEALADAVIQALTRVGFEVTRVPLTPQAWFDEVLGGARAESLDLVLATFSSDGDPDAWLHTRRADRGRLQPFSAGHPDVDRALDEVRRATDRLTARRELHAVLADTQALLPLWQTDAWSAWRAGLFTHQPLTPGDYFGAIERWVPDSQHAK